MMMIVDDDDAGYDDNIVVDDDDLLDYINCRYLWSLSTCLWHGKDFQVVISKIYCCEMTVTKRQQIIII